MLRQSLALARGRSQVLNAPVCNIVPMAILHSGDELLQDTTAPYLVSQQMDDHFFCKTVTSQTSKAVLVIGTQQMKPSKI